MKLKEVQLEPVITDEYVITLVDQCGGTREFVGQARYIPVLNKYLLNRYPDSDTYAETIYRMRFGIEERPKCPMCGKVIKFGRSKFAKTCSIACKNRLPEFKEKVRQTCIERYGGASSMCSKEVREKARQTNIQKYGDPNPFSVTSEHYKQAIKKKYGVDNVFQSEIIKQKIKDRCLAGHGVEFYAQTDFVKQSIQQTCLRRYGSINYLASKEGLAKSKQSNIQRYGVERALQNKKIKAQQKQTCIDRYGTENPAALQEFKDKASDTIYKHLGVRYATQSPEVRQKGYDTKHKNNTWNSSKAEEVLKEYLNTNGIKYTYSYRCELYPFNCDFYLPDFDLYIEIQGTWTHGRHEFDPTNQEDINTLCLWINKGTEFYKSAIHTWTYRDVLKRHTAKRNNLRYLEIFSDNVSDCIQALEDKLKTLEQG